MHIKKFSTKIIKFLFSLLSQVLLCVPHKKLLYFVSQFVRGEREPPGKKYPLLFQEKGAGG